MSDTTDNDKLRELVSEWRESNIDGEFQTAADQLEAVIESE